MKCPKLDGKFKKFKPIRSVDQKSLMQKQLFSPLPEFLQTLSIDYSYLSAYFSKFSDRQKILGRH